MAIGDMEEAIKKLYEIAFYTKAESAAPVARAITTEGGAIVEERAFEKVRLEFPIKKEHYAFMGAVRVSLPTAAVASVVRALSLAPEILRYLITEISEAASGSEAGDRDRKPAMRPRVPSVSRIGPKEPAILTNEAIERKIEEISQ